MNFISNLNYVAIAVIGGLQVAAGQMSLGDVVAFIQYSRQFTFPIIQTASIANVLQSAVASAERVFELLDEPEEIADPVAPRAARASRAARSRSRTSRSATSRTSRSSTTSTSSSTPASTVAIVGPTGAGKTTLVNLLMRFYEIDGGRITVDGVDTRELTRDDLRRTFGMVLQDTWLFHGTIRENIAYGREGATEEEIVAAAEAAHVDHFVRTLPDGYDTVIDDDATNLSAGEKQLLTIARAFLADPPILILDEATSSVDTRTEVLIQRAMARPDAAAGRRSSSPIGSRPSATPTRSWSWTSGAHRRAGHPRRAARARRLLRRPLPAASSRPLSTRPPDRAERRNRTIDRARSSRSSSAALRLGLTSFGGPIAHIGYFRREYVERRGWLDETAFADLVALCQSLPGPASSQLGIAIGTRRAGMAGGLAAWLGFTLPSAVALIALRLLVGRVDRPVRGGLGPRPQGRRRGGRGAGRLGDGRDADTGLAAARGRARGGRGRRWPGRRRSAQVAIIAAGGRRRALVRSRRRPDARHARRAEPGAASGRPRRLIAASPPCCSRCRCSAARRRPAGRDVIDAFYRSGRAGLRRRPCGPAAAGQRRSSIRAGCQRRPVPRRLRRGPGRARPAVHVRRVPRRRLRPAPNGIAGRGPRHRRDLPAVVPARVRGPPVLGLAPRRRSASGGRWPARTRPSSASSSPRSSRRSGPRRSSRPRTSSSPQPRSQLSFPAASRSSL